MCDTIRVLLADKQSLIRAGIRATLSVEEDLTLVGEATNGYEAQRLSKQLTPYVLLLDLNLPGSRVSETVAYLHEHCQKVKVLLLSTFDNVFIRDLVADGVMGCMLKDEEAETLVRAVRNVARGDTWFSRVIVEKLVRGEVNEPTQNGEFPLTDRERQILQLIAQGWNNACIAAELCLARQTVQNYASRIYPKLSVSSRAEAIIRARKHNFG